MLREKRISKPPVTFMIAYPEPRKSNNKGPKKHRNRKRCQFEMIPGPSKFINNFKIHPLYGDLVLMERNGIISLELSTLNKFKVCRNIEVTQKAATRVIEISVESKEEHLKIQWQQIIQKLKTSSTFTLNGWADIIQNFSVKYESFIKEITERNNKVAKTEQEEEEHTQITKETEKKISQLLEFFPAVYIKSRLQFSDINITEVTFNELFVREMGYSIDSFVTSVFQEGIPQFASNESEAIQHLTKILLENYFSIGPEGIITSESSLLLLMKSNYVRNVQAQIHFLMNYEGGGFGVDIIMTLIAKDQPYLDLRDLPKRIANTDFVQDMALKERNLADFLLNYYDESYTLRYNNFEKVCVVKELSNDKNNNLS